MREELLRRGAYIMTPEQCRQAGVVILKDGRLNADVVGQKPAYLAHLFGFSVPSNTKVLIGEVTEIGTAEPMSYEKLCPVLGKMQIKQTDKHLYPNKGLWCCFAAFHCWAC